MEFKENESLGEQCVDEIRRILELKNINASGRTSRSLDYRETPGSLEVFFNNSEHAPAFSLQHGSGPHRNSQPEGFVEAILRWVREKQSFTPLNGKKDNKSLNSAAWAIIQHIRKHGTKRYGDFTDVWQSVYEDAVVEFRKRYAIWVKQQIKDVMK